MNETPPPELRQIRRASRGPSWRARCRATKSSSRPPPGSRHQPDLGRRRQRQFAHVGEGLAVQPRRGVEPGPLRSTPRLPVFGRRPPAMSADDRCW